MSEPLYKCHHCLDVGVVICERKRSDGFSLGMFGSPCLYCANGDDERQEWEKNGLRRAANELEVISRRMENLLTGETPEAEAERWRSASRDRHSRREERAGPAPAGAGTDLKSAVNPSNARTSMEP